MNELKHKKLPSEQNQQYFQIKADDHQQTCYQGVLSCLGVLTGAMKIWCPCVCCCFDSPLYQLPTATTGILQKFGRFQKVIKPGFHVINPWTQKVINVDMRTNIINLRPQQVITKDNVTLQIDTVVYFRTVDPYKLVYKLGTNLGQIRQFISQMSFNALRNVAGQHVFQEILQKRQQIADCLQLSVAHQVNTWGLLIQNIFIKDLILSEEVKKNLQSAAIQKRVSEANIIGAKADVQAAKLLKQTSEILNSNTAMQIRYLQAIQNILISGGQKSMFINLKGKQ